MLSISTLLNKNVEDTRTSEAGQTLATLSSTPEMTYGNRPWEHKYFCYISADCKKANEPKLPLDFGSMPVTNRQRMWHFVRLSSQHTCTPCVKYCLYVNCYKKRCRIMRLYPTSATCTRCVLKTTNYSK